jgi:hypothetical protein
VDQAAAGTDQWQPKVVVGLVRVSPELEAWQRQVRKPHEGVRDLIIITITNNNNDNKNNKNK